jgi:hypothetical protein
MNSTYLTPPGCYRDSWGLVFKGVSDNIEYAHRIVLTHPNLRFDYPGPFFEASNMFTYLKREVSRRVEALV